MAAWDPAIRNAPGDISQSPLSAIEIGVASGGSGSAALVAKASAVAHHESDFGLLGKFDRIVDVDAKISYCALKLRMP